MFMGKKVQMNTNHVIAWKHAIWSHTVFRIIFIYGKSIKKCARKLSTTYKNVESLCGTNSFHCVWNEYSILNQLYFRTKYILTDIHFKRKKKCAGMINITKCRVGMGVGGETREMHIVSFSCRSKVLFLILHHEHTNVYHSILYASSYVSTLPNKSEPQCALIIMTLNYPS